MAQNKTIYTLKGVFTKMLEDNDMTCFMIPTYQRGYKWSSSGANSQIVTLMRDLSNGYEIRKNDKYYLQFITLKRCSDEFEVIDGQQRLTTITVIFSVLASMLEKQIENFINDKLKYQARHNFVKAFIYDNISLILESDNWEIFLDSNVSTDIDINNQDVYYLYHATKAIYEFLINKYETETLVKFYDYLCDQVLLIVNVLDDKMNSEKIFINVNKGVKLKDEDLVKGLLITKIPLDNQSTEYRMTETEINEVRANIGRQWDDLVRWSSREDIINFFKSDNCDGNRLGWLIQLAYPEVQNSKDTNPMFSYLDHLYRAEKHPSMEIFIKIRNTMLKLNDWFNEPELCNLLGYVLHSNKIIKIEKVWKELDSLQTKQEILKKLKSMCKALLPLDSTTGDLQELNYEDHRQKLFDLFLMLDVAKFLPIDAGKSTQYNFAKIANDNWSIEHIFPQNVKDFKNVESLFDADLSIIRELLPTISDEIRIDHDDKREVVIDLYNKIKAGGNVTIDVEERDCLGYLLKNNAGALHKLGNLALLQPGVNSGLSNHFFDKKRAMIVRKVSSGMFVPYHTYDVFSKLIIETETGMHVWSKADIEKHENYIKNKVKNVVSYLDQEEQKS